MQSPGSPSNPKNNPYSLFSWACNAMHAYSIILDWTPGMFNYAGTDWLTLYTLFGCYFIKQRLIFLMCNWVQLLIWKLIVLIYAMALCTTQWLMNEWCSTTCTVMVRHKICTYSKKQATDFTNTRFVNECIYICTKRINL